MSFWKPTKTKKKKPRPPDSGQAVPARKKIRRKFSAEEKIRMVLDGLRGPEAAPGRSITIASSSGMW